MDFTSLVKQRDLSQSIICARQAVELIPNATNTLARGPLNWVQGVAPSFLKRAEGAYVYDVDENRYIDFAIGLGPVLLGYNHPVVTNAVMRQLEEGNLFSLSNIRELELSQLLTEIIPCAEMVRLGRNGSDVTSAAVRLARAHTGRDIVIACGYHGFGDWYIGSTERNAGIPQAVCDLTKTFAYNNLDALRKLLAENKGQIACVIMEPVYADAPEVGFLETVKELTHQAGAVLIFDEIFVGFRFALGGAQEYFGVTPDLSCFSKAMANGLPISALVGRREVMKSFDEKQVFYSCTFSGEATGAAAAIACINYIREHNVIETVWKTGTQIIDRFRELTTRLGIDYLSMIGYAPRSTVLIGDAGAFSSHEMKTFFQQECIKRGYLFIGFHLPGLAHTEEVVDELFNIYEEVMQYVDHAVHRNQVQKLLEGEVLKPIFANVGDRSSGPSTQKATDPNLKR